MEKFEHCTKDIKLNEDKKIENLEPIKKKSSQNKKKLSSSLISWILKRGSNIEKTPKDSNPKYEIYSDTEDNNILNTSENFIEDNRCVLIYCLPGRKKKPKSKKQKNKKLKSDFEKLNREGITHILRLLGEKEMKSNGVDYKEYNKLCEKFSIQTIEFILGDYSSPQVSSEKINVTLLENLKNILENGGKIAIHCLAGVGRSGTIASCFLLKLGLFKSAKNVINYLRRVRFYDCVETKDQILYVRKFSEMLYGIDSENFELINQDWKKFKGNRELKKQRTKRNERLSKVLERLYLSSAMEAGMKKELDFCKITHVLVAARDLMPKFPKSYCYLQLDIQDLFRVELKKFYVDTFKFLDSAMVNGENRVLVHCMAGVSRSVSLVVAYLMLKLKMKFKPVLTYVKKRRSQASPNKGFFEQLVNFESVVKEYWEEIGEFSEFLPLENNTISPQYLSIMIQRPLQINFLIKILK